MLFPELAGRAHSSSLNDVGRRSPFLLRQEQRDCLDLTLRILTLGESLHTEQGRKGSCKLACNSRPLLPPPLPHKQIPLQNNESIEGTLGRSVACAVLERPLVAKQGPTVCPLSWSSSSSQGASPRPACPYSHHHDLPSRNLGSAPTVSIFPAPAGTQCLNLDVFQPVSLGATRLPQSVHSN